MHLKKKKKHALRMNFYCMSDCTLVWLWVIFSSYIMQGQPCRLGLLWITQQQLASVRLLRSVFLVLSVKMIVLFVSEWHLSVRRNNNTVSPFFNHRISHLHAAWVYLLRKTRRHSPGQWGRWGSSRFAEEADASSDPEHSRAAFQSVANTVNNTVVQSDTACLSLSN